MDLTYFDVFISGKVFHDWLSTRLKIKSYKNLPKSLNFDDASEATTATPTPTDKDDCSDPSSIITNLLSSLLTIGVLKCTDRSSESVFLVCIFN